MQSSQFSCLIAAENAGAIAACLPACFATLNCATPAFTLLEKSAQVAGALHSADILLAQPSWVAPHLHKAKNLRWLQSTFAGVEPLVSRGCRRDYLLTGVKDIFGPLMSEYVFGAILAHSRNSAYYRQCQLDQRWAPIAYQSLANKTLAIVGTGSIGCHLAQTAKHFGLNVVGVNRTGQALVGLDTTVAFSKLDHELRRADYVVLTLPSTPETKHLVDAAFIAKLNKCAVLINIGRGALINETDLLAALTRGNLAAAVLDVFETEPLPATSPLWQAPNLTITPHNAAVTFAEDIARIFAANYARFVQGQALNYVIDFERGY